MERNTNARVAITVLVGLLLMAGLACAQAGEILTPAEATARAQEAAQPARLTSTPEVPDEGAAFEVGDTVEFIGQSHLVPLYQDEKNILFSNIKYTPNDHDGWELNAGMGYRRLLWNNDLILGINAYYDKRRTDWGTNHEQWGIGLEAMADIPLEAFDLGLTGRFNYYSLSPTRRSTAWGLPMPATPSPTAGLYFTVAAWRSRCAASTTRLV